MNNDPPLLRFFMEPDIVKVEEERSPGDVKEKKTPLGPFRNIFYNTNNEPHCSTYLTADAGLGKTAYSKRLALAWCQAKKPLEIEAKHFSVEEIEVIGEFRFLFLVLLRYSPADECRIDDLILKQIISQVNCQSNINRSDIENILAKEKCLIILDGLDEWSHPSTCTQRDNPIPHCVNRGNLTVLTTTRPWKLSIIGLKSSQIDQRLEITGLNNESSNQLKHSVLSYFMCKRLEVSSLSDRDISKVKSDVTKFTADLKQKRLSSLEKVPLLLMYMLFLRHYKMDLGETLYELYSSIVELLLSRTPETCESRDVQTSPENIPPYFSQLKHCSRFYTQLTALGRLAYETLLGETKLENSLVFNSSIAEKYVEKDCLEFCFKTGIVSQSEAVQTHPLQKKFKVSFSHKTVQEFFAAIYMSTLSADNTGIMAESVITRCHYIQDILDMSKIFQFISGMNVQLAGCISQETRGIIDRDVRTQEYRNTADPDYYSRHPLEDLQGMFVLGCKEMPRENEVSLCLQDLFIDESCREEHYRESLRLLTTTNKQNIKSVHINMFDMRTTPYNTVQKVLEYFTLNNLENVEKISCVQGDIDDGVIPVLGSQVKCLCLSCLWWSPSYMSRSLCNTVRSLQKLEAIHIGVFTMSDSELRLLYDYISQRVCMREIELRGLHCTDHEDEGSCRGPSLDLSQHSQLRELTLIDLPLSELNIKMASLEKCHLQKLSLPALGLHPGSFGPANNKLNTSTVELVGVRMAASVLTDLVNGVQALPQTCDIANTSFIWMSKVSPRPEMERRFQQPIALSQLTEFLDTAVAVLGPETFGVAALAWSALYSLNIYQWTMDHLRHFNLPVLFGDPMVGKSLIASCGAWLNGCPKTAIASRCTLAYVTTQVTSTSMPFVWDDPTTCDEVAQLAVDLGNAAVRGKHSEETRVPLTGCLVTANFSFTEVMKYFSRIILLIVKPAQKKKQPGDAKLLEDQAHRASAAFPKVMQMLSSIDAEDVHRENIALAREISCDIRIIDGIALAVHITRQILNLAGRYQYMRHVSSYVWETMLPHYRKILNSEEQPMVAPINHQVQHVDNAVVLTNVTDQTAAVIKGGQFVAVDPQLVCDLNVIRRYGGQLNKATKLNGKTKKMIHIPLTAFSTQCGQDILRRICPDFRLEDLQQTKDQQPDCQEKHPKQREPTTGPDAHLSLGSNLRPDIFNHHPAE